MPLQDGASGGHHHSGARLAQRHHQVGPHPPQRCRLDARARGHGRSASRLSRLVARNELSILGASNAGGAVLAQTDDSALAAEELCRFLAGGPYCYEGLRLVPVDEELTLTFGASWLSLQDNGRHGVYYDFANLQAAAAALRRVADAHGLAVWLSPDAAYLSLPRIRPQREV